MAKRAMRTALAVAAAFAAVTLAVYFLSPNYRAAGAVAVVAVVGLAAYLALATPTEGRRDATAPHVLTRASVIAIAVAVAAFALAIALSAWVPRG
ncbi:MAG: hypothetical protein FJ029_03430 [Actinobacteria bacterium]|nr:hypothetical protein [Actinomycetota bacterium]